MVISYILKYLLFLCCCYFWKIIPSSKVKSVDGINACFTLRGLHEFSCLLLSVVGDIVRCMFSELKD